MFKTLGRRDKFLEIENITNSGRDFFKYSQKTWNKLNTVEYIDNVFRELYPQNVSGPDGFMGEFYLLFKLFHSKGKAGKLPSSFYEASTTLYGAWQWDNKRKIPKEMPEAASL